MFARAFFYQACVAGVSLFLGLARLLAGEAAPAWYERVWQTDDGLPSANVTGIVQTPDGFLWLGTQAGLARFDGVQFQDAPLPLGRAHAIIRAMTSDAAGNFWVAEDGGVVLRFGPAGPRLFTAASGLPASLPLQVLATPDGSAWLGYADTVVVRILPDGQVTRVRFPEALTDDGTASLALDRQGQLWFAKADFYGVWEQDHFVKRGRLPARNAQLLGARSGGLWICTPDQLLKAGSNGLPQAVADLPATNLRSKPAVLYEDTAGRVWIGTATDGLFEYSGTNLCPVPTSQNKIRTIMQDREGSLWVGTDGGGLNRLRTRTVELHGRDEGLPFETVRSMCEDRAGTVWLVTQDGTLSQLAPGQWTGTQKIPNWPGYQTHCVAADRQQGVWIGTYQHGLMAGLNGTFTRYGSRDGLLGNSIRSLLVDSRNDVWIGPEGAPFIQRLHSGRFQSFPLPPGVRSVRAMAEDASRQIWLGTLDGSLFKVVGEQLVDVPQPLAGSAHPIRCLAATPDGSVWIGYYARGLGRLKAGKFSHIGRAAGLFDGNICCLMPDVFGRMWFAADRGIFYVTLAQLNACAEGGASSVLSVFYGRDSGLPSLEAYYGYWPGALQDHNGQILFPTHSGIATVHPDRVEANLPVPQVVMQTMRVDGHPLAVMATTGRVVLPPDHRRLEFEFTAPSFIAPEQLQFSYRLIGWSKEWSEASTLRSAVFSRLPAGDYRFEVMAVNRFGVWNKNSVTAVFTVSPFFWQTWWFRLAAAGFILVAMAGLVRFFSQRRVRAMVRIVEQQAALQRERTRIAQDMHDELGARFTQISLLGELTRNALPDPDQARGYMDQISRVAQVGVKSLDEIVWAVNPRNDTLADLLDYSGQYAVDFLQAAGVRCRLDYADSPANLPIAGDIRHAVFLIIKEALHNVVKHAQARQVRLTFDLTETSLVWRLEDDGQGFAQAPDNALADGLRNIQQRATALGGLAKITSRPGAGTVVTLEIPRPK